MTDHSAARARYHVEGQTSTVGPRWGIWDGVDGHFLRYRNIADEGDAVALCAKLNEYARALTPPEGNTVSLPDALAKQVIDRTIERCKALPDYAGRPAWDEVLADEIRVALQSRVSPQAGMREALERARKALAHILGGALSLPRFATSEAQDSIEAIDAVLSASRMSEDAK